MTNLGHVDLMQEEDNKVHMKNIVLGFILLATMPGPTSPEVPPPVKGANGPTEPKLQSNFDTIIAFFIHCSDLGFSKLSS